MSISLNNEGTAGLMTPEHAREMADQMEALIATLPAAACRLNCYLLPGMYVKELTIPAGVVLSGHTHLTEHAFIVSKGDHSFWTAETGAVRVQAPFFGITKPGTRRIGFSHEETVWTTFHPNPDNLTAEEMDRLILSPWDNPYIKQL
jgi:hypothetical protein